MSSGQLVAVFADQHAPHHDPVLHRKACAWLRRNQPAKLVLAGDLLDFATISRHMRNPDGAYDNGAQECLEIAHQIVRDYRRAAGPKCEIVALPGNHDIRIRSLLLAQAPELWSLRQAGGGEQVNGLPHLLNTGKLGVRWELGDGEYARARVVLTDDLAVRHGHLARKHAGASVLAHLEQSGWSHSLTVGHCHRQAIVQRTLPNLDGSARTVWGVEAGTMASIVGGLGYCPTDPDWQQGFCTWTVHRNGVLVPELARFINGHIYWRDQRS